MLHAYRTCTYIIWHLVNAQDEFSQQVNVSLNKIYGHELVLILKQYLFNSYDLSYADNAFIIENNSTGDLHNLKLTNIIFIILMPPQSFGGWYTTVCWKYFVSINLSNCTSVGKHDFVYLSFLHIMKIFTSFYHIGKKIQVI